MANKQIMKIIRKHPGSGPGMLKNYLVKQGFSEKEVNEAMLQAKEQKPSMGKNVNRFLTVGIIIFLIIVFLFGFYMLYFAK